MQCVILAGGFGTRLSEQTKTIPKPLVEIGNIPILVHIMRRFSRYGIRRFVICAGYKAEKINNFFSNYSNSKNDFEYDFSQSTKNTIVSRTEDWSIKVINTGLETLTGGRLRKVTQHLDDGQPFFMTYGDGLADVDIQKLYDTHISNRRLATVTAVEPPARFGALEIDINNNCVTSFSEKPKGEFGWINGGFFVLEKECLAFIDGDLTSWEKEPLEKIASNGQLTAYKHNGFFQPMDTERDRIKLNEIWNIGEAPWVL